MKTARVLISITLLICFFPSPALSLDSMLLGGVSVSLGMNKQAIKNKLGKSYSLIEPKDSPDIILIFSSGGNDYIGNVVFENDKAKTIENAWATGSTSASFVKNFIRLFQFVNGYKTVDCIVEQKSRDAPTFTTRGIEFKCGKQVMQFNYVDRNEKLTVQLTEIIRMP